MVDRKFIFLGASGSHLYGTNLPSSDEDYKGVYLPSIVDLLSLTSDPQEISESVKYSTGPRNEAGDIDKKYYTLKKFLKHAADGQPWALEMLFVPDSQISLITPEWDYIRNVAKTTMFSKRGVAGFLGMAASQAYKASVKGDNLNKIRALIEKFRSGYPSGWTINNLVLDRTNTTASLLGVDVNVTTAKDGTEVIEIAGRMFNFGLNLKTFHNSLILMEQRYGTRSNTAARSGVDPKSLYHAYRLLSEAREFLTTGKITLPRPDKDFLLEIRNGLHSNVDHHTQLLASISEIEDVVAPSSFLPDEPDWDAIDDVCIAMLSKHLHG